jgi:arylsulfatase A-like enzyme
MKRYLSHLLLVVCVAVIVAIPAYALPKPNVVLIVVDDLGYADMSCTGLASDVATPHMDMLAEQGVRFTSAYASAPICNASRIGIMTGRYQQRQGVRWYSGKGLHRSDYPTLAETLQKEGYATGYIGKFHHGAKDSPADRGFPLNHGFETFFGFSGGTKHYLHHAKDFQGANDKLHQGPMWEQGERKDVEGFTTELFGERARQFIQGHEKEPFYLHLSFNAVHNFTHQLPVDYLEEHGLEKFPDQAEGEDYWEWRKKIGYPAHPNGRDYYLGQLNFLDLEVGRVIEQLEQLGLRDHTLVILVSDNGGSLVTYANNAPLKGGKYTLFEGGIRVPMIISFPERLEPGMVTDYPASLLDLFPTICELTDSDVPEGLDGASLVSVLSDSNIAHKRKDLFWDTGMESAIRLGKWKLLQTMKSPNPQLQIEPTPVGTFLFDLKADSGEAKDLAATHPDLVEELSAKLEIWKSTIQH